MGFKGANEQFWIAFAIGPSAVKHLSRDATRHGMRELILNDNMSDVLANQKCRCKNRSLLMQNRRGGGLYAAETELSGFTWQGASR